MHLAVRWASLERFGVENLGAVHENLPPARLVEASVRRREGMIGQSSGALVVKTGKRTGRDYAAQKTVDWPGCRWFPLTRCR